MKVIIAVAHEVGAPRDCEDAVRCAHSIESALAQHHVVTKIMEISLQDMGAQRGALIDSIHEFAPDCVFNIFEGFSKDVQKEIEFARLLEDEGIAFTGNPSSALKTCLNKYEAKRVLLSAGVSVPAGKAIYAIDHIATGGFSYPVFIKPCCEDASVGIDRSSLCQNEREAVSVAKKKLAQFPAGLLLEEFIDGCEYNASFTGISPYSALAVSMVDYKQHAYCPPFLTYAAKWDERSQTYNSLQPEIIRDCSSEKRCRIIELCSRAAAALGCRGYFRVDVREKKGHFFVIDVNPNPDLNVDAGFARQAEHAGFPYHEIIYKITCEAQRYDSKRKNA